MTCSPPTATCAEAAGLRRRAAEASGELKAALQRVKRLREAVYHVFSALAAGGAPAAFHLDLIETEAHQAQAPGGWYKGRGYAWTWLAADLEMLTSTSAHRF